MQRFCGKEGIAWKHRGSLDNSSDCKWLHWEENNETTSRHGRGWSIKHIGRP